jgi:hypothetical protein
MPGTSRASPSIFRFKFLDQLRWPVLSSCGRIFGGLTELLNLRRSCRDIPEGWGIFDCEKYWRAAMPKAARISSSVPVTSASENSDSAQLISIALFSGIGLLISLVAVLMGVQGVWI